MKRDISAIGIGIAALTLGWTAVVGAEEMLVVAMKPASVDRELVRHIAAVGPPTTVDAKAGVTVGDLVRGRCGNVDANYLALLKAANPQLSMPDWNSDTQLPQPTTVEMPACVRFSSFAAQQSKDANSWSEILLKDAQARLSMLAEIRKRQANIKEEVSNEVKLYSNLSPEELKGACQMPPTDPAFDTVELLQVIASNNRNMPPLTRGMPVVVMVPDTGLYTNDAMPFPIHRVDRLGWSRSPLDHNEGIAPHATLAQRQHGTQVASIALGGPALIGLLDSLDIRLRLAPVNILEADGRVGIASLSNAISIADNVNAVVNLSVGRQVPFEEVTRALEARSDVLFVVAAGNDGASLLQRRVYPANQGGSNNAGRHNLITVAALDSDGKLAAFSNRDARYVDIAAPGCLQPAYEKNDDSGYRVVEVSGTSFAAPHVSFTAALLRAMWPNSVPRRIKSRILSGADVSPLLDPTQVAFSRKLNVVKALAIYQDVVEAKVAGNVKRIRGHLASPAGTLLLCGETLKLSRNFAPGWDIVRRIARIAGPPEKFLVDWEDENGEFKTDLCAAEDLPVRILEEDTGTMHQIASSDVVDIVFAETR